MPEQKEKAVNWEKEFKDKQKECEQLVAQIEELKKKPVLDQVLSLTDEFLVKLKQIQIWFNPSIHFVRKAPVYITGVFRIYIRYDIIRL